MRAENMTVAAAFTLSYQDLTAGPQRLFRRLGLVPGPSIDNYAAAALDGTSLDTARRHLNELFDQHLLTEPAPGPLPAPRPAPRARPRAGRRRQPRRIRRRDRAAAGLLPSHRPGRRLAHPGLDCRPGAPAARAATGPCPRSVHVPARGGLAGSRTPLRPVPVAVCAAAEAMPLCRTRTRAKATYGEARPVWRDC